MLEREDMTWQRYGEQAEAADVTSHIDTHMALSFFTKSIKYSALGLIRNLWGYPSTISSCLLYYTWLNALDVWEFIKRTSISPLCDLR